MADSLAELPKSDLIDIATSARRAVARMKVKGKEIAAVGFAAVEVTGAAFGAGWMRSRFADENGEFNIVGVPAELLLGGVGHSLALMGVGAQYDEHIHNLSNGMLAGWGYAKGLEWGQEDVEEPVTSGARRRMTAQDVVNAARAAA